VKQNPEFGKRNKLIWVTSYGKKLRTLQLQGKPKHNETARKFEMEENEVVLLLFFCNVEEWFFIAFTLTPQKHLTKENHIT